MSYAGRFATPLGEMTAIVDAAGALTHLMFGRHKPASARALAAAQWDAARIEPIRHQLEGYFAGTRRTFDLPLKPPGSPFQQQVWRLLCEIPHGCTASYGDVAAQLGRPTAARAVGAANGANPIAVVIPCHRLVSSAGALVDYAGGLDVKRALLAHEKACAAH